MIIFACHIILFNNSTPDPTSPESFVELGRMGILDGAFSKKISYAAGLRNRIAHEYDDIDAAKLLEAAQSAKTYPNTLSKF